MIKKLLLILTLGFTACNEIRNSNEAEQRVTYFKDARTNLCFAQVLSTTTDGYSVSSITCVPCDSVKNLLR